MAIGLMMAPERASAQAFQATENVVSGDVFRAPEPTTDIIEVNTPTAVIEWTPDEDGVGNALDFLPVDNTATFRNGPSVSDFAILNIILPAANGNVTVFDGTVISQLTDPFTGAMSSGGTVVFYSPTGIFVGDNAVFDVGNLILTTLEPDQASFDAFATAGGTLIQGGTPTTATIAINPGAQITASAENSYFAVTAAEISMFGTADINGSHAYVAGEAVNLTVSNGLFDIEIPVGTSAANAITLDGNVGGPSSTGVGDNHLIYAVAAAQNDPISMIFSGNLGFDPAASAGIVNGEIILSANYEVSGRDVDGGSITDGNAALFDADSALTDTPGSIFLEDFTSTSSILAIANEEVQVTAFNGPSSIDGNLIAVGRNFAELTASNNQTLGITGDVFVSADDFGRVDVGVDPIELDAVAGTAFIDAFDGGILNIDGSVLVSARAVAGADLVTFESGSATGGNATVASTGGTLNILGDVEIEANAGDAQIADDFLFGNVFTAGTVQVFASQAGQVQIDGTLSLNANANGTVGSTTATSTESDAFSGIIGIQTFDGSSLVFGSDVVASAVANAGVSNDTAQAGLADGGDVFVNIADGGTIDVGGNLQMTVSAAGGQNFGGRGGDALGGAARVLLPNGGALTVVGGYIADGSAIGGSGIGGGDAFGGIAGAQVVVGLVDISGDVTLDASAFGGDADQGFGGDGGNGTGGSVLVRADGSLLDTATVNIGGFAAVRSRGLGGTGGAGDGSVIASGMGGSGSGGSRLIANQADTNFVNGAVLLAGGDNGNLTIVGNVAANSDGIGGNGGTGGLGQDGGDGGTGSGGSVEAGLALLGGDGSVGAGTSTFNGASTLFDANGVGGSGGNGGGTGAASGNGGDAIGGVAEFSAVAGLATSGAFTLSARADAGSGDTGGVGTGGTAAVIGGLSGSLNSGRIQIGATGRGGGGFVQGGEGFGGQALTSLDDMNVSIDGNLVVTATGDGGDGGSGIGGTGTGGLAEISIRDDVSALSVTGFASVNGSATGGTGSDGAGGQANGGTGVILVDGLGTISIDGSALTTATATGGNSQGLELGGDGFGGVANLSVDNGGAITVGGLYNSTSTGIGGTGLSGGDGFGGVAGADVVFGTIQIDGSATLNAVGTGGLAFSPIGFGGDGGDGFGGSARVRPLGTATEAGSITIAAGATLLANGAGGAGGAGDGSVIAAGRGGDGFGGNLSTSNQADATSINGAVISLNGDGSVLNIGGTTLLNSVGTGGAGGSGGLFQSGGDGGNGIGGSAVTNITSAGGSAANGTAVFDTLNVLADGFGGAGGFGGSTGDPQGNGGDGTVGAITARVAVTNASLTANAITVAANGIGGDGGNGGIGTAAGVSGLTINQGGSVTTGALSIFALGVGGDGLSGVGGAGVGGSGELTVDAGTAQIIGDSIINSSGTGGESADGDGANGTGGNSQVLALSLLGDLTIDGHASLLSNGIGGDAGTDFTGGTGQGGTAVLVAVTAGTANVGSAQIVASGQGGSGALASGGEGVGGDASIFASNPDSNIIIQNSTPFGLPNNGPLTQSNSLLVAAGIGGDANGGVGLGGTGTGGTASIRATNGGAIALPADPAGDINGGGANRIVARGTGGGSSVEGGAGGLAFGGVGLFEADNGTISTGATLYSIFSFGGASLDPAANIDGGDAEGGSRDVSVTNGGVITAEFIGGISGGFGGAGSGTGVGGAGLGGSQMISVDSGTLNLVGTSIFVDQPLGGAGFVGGDAVGGTVDFIVSNGTVTISPNAAGEAVLSIGGAAFGGEGVDQGGDATGETVNVSFDNSTLTGGPLNVGAEAVGGSATGGTGIGGNAVGGEATFLADNTEISLTAANSVLSNATGGAGETGGNATAGTASFTVSNDNLTIAADGLTPGSLEVASNATGGDGVLTVGDATGGTARFQSDNNIVIADALEVTATANSVATISGASSGAAIGGESQALFNGGTDLSLQSMAILSDAIGGINGSTLGGTAFLSIGTMTGTGGTPEGNVADLDLSANAAGASAGANTSGTFRIEALEGRFTFDEVAATALGDQAQAGEMGTSSIVADGGDVLVNDTLLVDLIADLTVENRQGSILGSFDAASPTANIDIETQGAITFLGDDDAFVGVRGSSIALTSRNLVIEDGARIGGQVVNLVSLNTDDPAIIGGTGAPGGVVAGEGYTATEAELNRINVNFFSFTQSEVVGAGANDPDIVVRDLNFSGAFGRGVQSATIIADGADSIIRADGTLVIIDAGPVDTLSVRAGDRIEVVTPTSGIGVVDLDDNPTGLVSLTADNIWTGDADLIAQLQADPNFAGRDDQLSVTAAGSEEPLGFLRGGSVELSVGTSLLVRNTGTATEQAGILVGDGGLSIFNSDPMSGVELDVFAYGARRQTDGTFVTGEAFFGEVNFNNGGGTGSITYSAAAELNDCVINTSECEVMTTIIAPEPEPEPGLPQAVIEEAAVINNPTVVEAAISTTQPVTATEQESNDEFGMDFPGLVEESEIEEDADVEDPVASGGDSSLYGQAGNGTVRVEGN